MRARIIQSLSLIAAFSLAAGASAQPIKPGRSRTTSVDAVVAAPTAPTPRSQSPRRRSVEVLWGGTWWPAEILETRSSLTKVRYTGWGPEWDEWIEPARMRPAASKRPLTNARVGQRVLIEWHGTWWDGEVIEQRSGFSKVHYTGWGPEWDEWVEPARLRATTQARVVTPRR